jgi:hypothetical protein
VSYHYYYIRIYGTYNGRIYGGTYSTAKYGLIYIYIYDVLKYGGPPADGGHPGGRRTGGRADTPAGSGQGGGRGRYTTDGNTCLRYGGREDTEGAPTLRQGRCIKNNIQYNAIQHYQVIYL